MDLMLKSNMKLYINTKIFLEYPEGFDLDMLTSENHPNKNSPSPQNQNDSRNSIFIRFPELATKSGSLDTMNQRLPQEKEDSISQSFSAIRSLTRA
jgi:hypothetical protein